MTKTHNALIASTLLMALYPAVSFAETSPAPSTETVQINQDMLEQLKHGRRSFKRYSGAQDITVASATPAARATTYAEPEIAYLSPEPKQPTLSKKDMLSEATDITVRTLGRTPPPFSMWEATWDGRINVGASLQKGNGESSNLDIDGKTTAKWENGDRVIFNGRIAYQEDNEEETVDERQLNINFNDFINEKTYIDYDAFLENDDVAGVDFRSTAGAGIGYQAFDHDKLKVDFSAGIAYLIEEMSTDQGDEETNKEIAYSWKLNFERELENTVTTLYHNHRLIVPAEHNNNYVFTSNTGLRVPLRNSLIASLDVRHDIDEGVEAGFSETDTKYSAKIGYEW